MMVEGSKPIKRTVQLAPLSREHHEGLLFAWKIKQGIDNNAPLDMMRKYALWYWKHHIKPHFFQEEKILVPFFPNSNPLAERMMEEHDQIRELILGLDDEPDKRSLTILCELIDRHIRFEEREVFPYLEQHVSPAQLNNIYVQLVEHPVSCDEWKEEFWVKK